ncbi:hypothetical protein EVAR_76831_1 [Eumeta japonica]|uniref:Uncharacterized protein n=1 Tax=Eumeta variegata TaxID=151549 RepID=A0A4C1Z619_EUMVA|nr:hypothetical protein EVAR_76831_1 [Eumeta japonica]
MPSAVTLGPNNIVKLNSGREPTACKFKRILSPPFAAAALDNAAGLRRPSSAINEDEIAVMRLRSFFLQRRRDTDAGARRAPELYVTVCRLFDGHDDGSGRRYSP